MAVLPRDILKSYFHTGAYPTEEQFASLIDSMRHQTDNVPMEKVSGLMAALNDRASYASVSELLRLLRLKELVQFYCEDGGGLPLFTMAMANWANNCYLNEEDTRGISLNDVQNISAIFLSGESDYYTRLLTAHTENTDATLRQGVNTLAYIDGAPLRITVPAASSEQEGLMSAEDKAKLDSMSGGGGADSAATVVIDAISNLPSVGGTVRIGDTIMNFNSYNEVQWKKIDLLTLSTNGMGGQAAYIDTQTNKFIGYDSNYQAHYIYTDDQNGNALTVESDGETFNIPGWSDVVIESDKVVYAIILSVATASGTQNLTLTDENGEFTCGIAATTTMTDFTLDFGTAGLPSGCKLILAATDAAAMILQIKVTLKVIIP